MVRMVVNRKVTGTASAMPVGLAIGAGVSLGVTLLGCGLLAWLIDSGKVPQTGIGYGALGILLAGSLLGAAAAYGRIQRRRMLVCLLSGLIYFAALLGMTALFFGGQYQGMGVTALVIFGGSLCTGLLGLRGQGRGRRHHRKKYATG